VSPLSWEERFYRRCHISNLFYFISWQALVRLTKKILCRDGRAPAESNTSQRWRGLVCTDLTLMISCLSSIRRECSDLKQVTVLHAAWEVLSPVLQISCVARRIWLSCPFVLTRKRPCRQEGFKQKAKSPNGSLGLVQVPSTHRATQLKRLIPYTAEAVKIIKNLGPASQASPPARVARTLIKCNCH